MMNEMKFLLLLLAGVAALAGDLAQVRTVYILPMAGGLDMHLANRLTDGHVLQVVTEVKRADAVFTDRLGPAFEDRMTELYPPPEPPKPAPPAKDAKEKAEAAGPAMPNLGDSTVNKVSKPAASGFGGGRGTVFLVSVKSRDVLWSTYAKPKDARSEQLERTAAKICADLKKSLAGK